MTHKEVLLFLARSLRRKANKKGNVHIDDIDRTIDMMFREIEERERETTPVKKLLFVEDGTVDTDELIETLAMSNPEIKVVVYRQGGRTPELTDVTEAENKRLKEQHLKLMDEHDEYGNLALERLCEIDELKEQNAELQKQVDELKVELQGQFNKGVDCGFRMRKFQKSTVEKRAAKKIFEKIFEVLCCFSTQGKSEEYNEGYIQCLEEVDDRLQKLAKEKGVEVD